MKWFVAIAGLGLPLSAIFALLLVWVTQKPWAELWAQLSSSGFGIAFMAAVLVASICFSLLFVRLKSEGDAA